MSKLKSIKKTGANKTSTDTLQVSETHNPVKFVTSNNELTHQRKQTQQLPH